MTASQDWADWRRSTDIGTYDDRWRRMADAGLDPHGEVGLVQRFAPRSVLDAGCGTGRVAIELDRRGVAVVGLDNDADMLTAAREKAPHLSWVHASIADTDLNQVFDVVVMAGNVMVFAAPSERGPGVAALARHLSVDGRLIAGFELRRSGPSLADYDAMCAAAGLVLDTRFATWDGAPYEDGAYAVSVHRRT